MGKQPPWFPGHLRDLSRAECLELLTVTEVGRVAYCDEDGPVVLPVNYVFVDGVVLFRVSPYSLLARRLRWGAASFEIDDIDPFNETGWSVLVRGDADHLPPDRLPESDDKPTPWAEGERTYHVRITPSSITGRRILPA